ncbi:NTP transferase domain-containing protein [archaeon AH-315-M20]|nr:NTP transferase domain-containing protein [archaeon AH-315-M20]
MKGIILAGGRGLRLYPLTKVTNKHLLPIGKEPMIFNPIRKLTEAGIKDIMVVTSTDHMGSIVNLLGSGTELGVNFTYKVQESSKGIAHALSLAQNFVHDDKMVVILGDNITIGSIVPFIEKFKKQDKGAKVLLKKVENPTRFGVAAIDEHQVLEIKEKPNKPKSNYAVIGYYMYDSKVFDIISKLKPSDRGEYEITDVNNEYIKMGELTYDFLEAEWTDAGTFESLLYANNIVLKEKKTPEDDDKVTKKQLKAMIDDEKKKIEQLEKYLK